ncbi:MAG: GNAT family N-acetyltransferase [Bacteroidota bacterium]
MTIRLANRDDVYQLSKLIWENTEHVKENNYTPLQVKTWKEVNRPEEIEKSLEERLIFCAYRDEELLGTIGLRENEIVGLYVNYRKRQMGIGGKLMQFVEDHARKKGINNLTLTSTPSARQFYERRGYEPIKSVIVEVRGAAFSETLMRKELV